MPFVVSRRAFLQLVAAGGAATVFSAPAAARAAAPSRIASTLPLPGPHTYFPSAEVLLTALLAPSRAAYDLVLAPSYLIPTLLQRDLLSPLPPEAPKVLGRPHDPEAAFTVPYVFGRSVWLGATAPLEAPTVYLPADLRLALSAVLQAQGHSPNARHAGLWAQAVALLQTAPFRLRAVANLLNSRLPSDNAGVPAPASQSRDARGNSAENSYKTSRNNVEARAALGWQWATAQGVWPAEPVAPSLFVEYAWALPRAAGPALTAFLAAEPAPAVPPYAGATPLQTLAPGVFAQLD